jgi:uncharacterized membrane protein YkvI
MSESGVSTPPAATGASIFRRFLLPGFAFKAVVIGGGYATGRELAEYFAPGGPWGGLLGMTVTTFCWSVVCIATFLFARAVRAYDYGTFFRALLGPGWPLFDVAYASLVIIMLSVFGAAAGAIGAAVFGLPPIVGTLALVVGIAGVAAFGNESVERLFKYVTYFLYATYALFFVLSLTRTGGAIVQHLATAGVGSGWLADGLTYAGYNIVGAAAILPVTRHLTSRRDALIAGALAGPLGMLPAFVFFICMTAYDPAIRVETLPSDYMLSRLGSPAFHVLFQVMILAALLESGTGAIHAINQRIMSLRTGPVRYGAAIRFAVSASILFLSIFVAQRFGLVALIARGYRLLAYLFIGVYVVPLLTRLLLTPARFGIGRS